MNSKISAFESTFAETQTDLLSIGDQTLFFIQIQNSSMKKNHHLFIINSSSKSRIFFSKKKTSNVVQKRNVFLFIYYNKKFPLVSSIQKKNIRLVKKKTTTNKQRTKFIRLTAAVAQFMLCIYYVYIATYFTSERTFTMRECLILRRCIT